ncbi:MAG: diaminopimelate epimerase [Planctomycetes bacterium]|nr:diaminopimelate epimerase [Planctomycetota bacterium]NUQ34594.1 diaminopimelate epimerase [Planctomycetaceae bacterium]
MAIPLVKMQGAGNDYVYVDAINGDVTKDEPALARAISDRHFGVGGDGLIFIKKSRAPDAKYRMHMFNADGSQGEMCGNGLRCVAKFLFDRGLEKDKTFAIDTDAGVLTVEVFAGADKKAEQVRINMGQPRLMRAEIPMSGAPADERVINQTVEIDGKKYAFTAVSMGNPHCVIYVDDPDKTDVHGIGWKIEHHPLFPKRVNVEFVQVVSPTKLIQRTWERGTGETLACGTGASAVCVAGVLTGKSQRKVTIKLRGGELELEWNEKDNCVYKKGPAVEVFSGIWQG